MSKGIYYNENVQVGPRGDYITLDITGNKSEDVNIFQDDLSQGEKIVKEFNVDLAPAVARNLLMYYIMCVCTFGMYYVYIRYCGCCRPKAIEVKRAKLCLTSLGRLGVWISDISGMQAKGARGDRLLSSLTKISWFKINDISHLQHVHFDSKTTSCFCCPTHSWSSTLRVFFGVYPDQALYDASNLALGIPKTFTMARGLEPNTIATYFSMFYFLQQAAGQIAGLVFQSLGVAGLKLFDDSVMLEIVTNGRDKKHNDEAVAFAELLEIQRSLLTIRKSDPALKAKNTNKVIVERAPCELIQEQIAHVDISSVAMVEGESFVDALTYITSWTFKEILYTICTLGAYWFFVARYRHGLKAAMIISTHRVFEICQRTTPVGCSQGSEKSWIVRSWFLSDLDSGIIAREKNTVFTEVQTRFGSLRLTPYVKISWYEYFFGNMSDEKFQTFHSFMVQFASTDSPKLLNVGSQISIAPQMMTDYFPMVAGESVASHFPGSGFKYNGCQTQGCGVPNSIAYIISLGRYPVNIQQQLTVTSHRILALAEAKNKPITCDPCLESKFTFMFWSSITSRYFIGSQVKGNVSVQESWLTRLCACCGFTGVSVESSLALAYAYASDRKGFPVSIQSAAKNATSGLLEQPELTKMRNILGAVHSAKCAYGAQPYFAASQGTFEPPVYDMTSYPQVEKNAVMNEKN